MKKGYVFLLIFMVVSTFMFTGVVFATENEKTCTVMQLGELRELAARLKVTYAPKTKVMVDVEDSETGTTTYTAKFIDIKVYNMHSKLLLRVESDAGYSAIASVMDLGDDGSLTFRQNLVDRKVNYEFKVVSDEYGCHSQVLRTIKLSLPMYNIYSELEICSDVPEYYLCQEFVTFEVDGATFYDKVGAYKMKLLAQGDKVQEDNTGIVNKTFAGASKFKYLIVGVIVILGVLITILIIKRKENA